MGVLIEVDLKQMVEEEYGKLLKQKSANMYHEILYLHSAVNVLTTRFREAEKVRDQLQTELEVIKKNNIERIKEYEATEGGFGNVDTVTLSKASTPSSESGQSANPKTTQ